MARTILIVGKLHSSRILSIIYSYNSTHLIVDGKWTSSNLIPPFWSFSEMGFPKFPNLTTVSNSTIFWRATGVSGKQIHVHHVGWNERRKCFFLVCFNAPKQEIDLVIDNLTAISILSYSDIGDPKYQLIRTKPSYTPN